MLPKRIPEGEEMEGLEETRSTDHSPRSPSNLVSIDRQSGLVWRGPEYPVLDSGRYTVRAVTFQGPQWVRSYMRWSLRLEFSLVTEPGSISAFFNFGNDPHQPRIGRRSRYYKAWVLANGEHPRKRQVMSPETFLDGQFFEVDVESCNRDEHGQQKPEAELYSRVTHIFSATWP